MNGIEPERFVALWAGCDTGNSNEAEAITKFRALRRMVVTEGLRIVDVMGRADVMAAFDAQLQPLRGEDPQLTAAFAQITDLANDLAREKEITAELRVQLASNMCAASPPLAPPIPPRVSDGGLINGGLVAAVSIAAAALLVAAAFQALQ